MMSSLTLTVAQAAQPVYLLSWWKPVLVLVVMLPWAWAISELDKDAAYYYFNRFWWNAAQMGCGVVTFVLILLIPIFFVGWIIGIAILAGGLLGYAYYRNLNVPENERWTLSLDSFRHKFEARQRARAQKHATVVLLNKDDSRREVPVGEENPRAAAHEALETMVDFAVPRGADRVQLLVDGKRGKMVARVDGVNHPQPDLDPDTGVALIDYLKEAAGLDLDERRKRQHGSVKLEAGELGRHTLEIETSGSTRGLGLLVEVDAQLRTQMGMGHLGLLDSQKQQLQEVVNDQGRVVVISAPSGQGLSTTLYSMLQEHDPYVQSIVAFEDEVELEVEGVSHQAMGRLSSQQYKEKMASVLRSDPGVVLITDLPDASVAALAAESAEEIRFYVAMSEENTFGAMGKWVKLVGDRQLAAGALGAVTSQRLVRRLCTTCRTPYKPDPSALRKLNLPVDRVGRLYHASGQVMEKDNAVECPDCRGMGYKGRVAVFEVMTFDDDARSLLAKGDMDKLRSHLRKQKMLWLQEAGLSKVVEGVTDIKEITRTLGDVSKSGKRRSSSSSGDRKEAAAT